MISFLISFVVVHDLLVLHWYLHRHDHLHQLNIRPVCLFISIIVQGRIITTTVNMKNHETAKPTERLKNRPTKKPYSTQVLSKTTTFYQHESSWQKQLTNGYNTYTSLVFFSYRNWMISSFSLSSISKSSDSSESDSGLRTNWTACSRFSL